MQKTWRLSLTSRNVQDMKVHVHAGIETQACTHPYSNYELEAHQFASSIMSHTYPHLALKLSISFLNPHLQTHNSSQDTDL